MLRAWLRFAVTQREISPYWRDISPYWIAPVVDAVDTYLAVFHDAFDDETAWGPAKQVAAALTERGIDLAGDQLNAEQLAQRLQT